MIRIGPWCALLFLAALPAFAQYQTPTVDGVVSPGEYAHGSGNWSMTWDATYLYVANTAMNDDRAIVVYVDVDPLSTPTGGTNASGNLSGYDADHGITPLLPFRADLRALLNCVCAGTSNLRSRDGSGSWSAENTNASDFFGAANGSTREMRIRWAAMPGLTGVPSSFRWLAHVIDTSATTQIIDPMPAANPTGNALAPTLSYFQDVAATGDGTSTDPFSVRQSTWRVTSNADSGAGTLRDAIASVNADTASTRRFVVFNDIGSNTITNTSDLAAISQTVTIDGTTAPGYSSTPVLVVQGFNTTSDQGIRLSSASSCVVRGLVLQNHGAGVKITGGSSHTIAGNYFGTSPAGTASVANGTGISIDGCTSCTIGGTTAADRNLLSGSNNGITVLSSSLLTIQGNYFGTKANGNEILANDADIQLTNAGNTLIGGIGTGGNVLGASQDFGILAFDSDDVSIYGNSIGIGADGTTVLGGAGTGILLILGGQNVTIGSLSASAGNRIVNMAGNAIVADELDGGLTIRGNALEQNDAGVDVTGPVVQPAPTVSLADVSNGELTLSVSLTSSSTSAPTQSVQLDLYDADTSPGAGAQGKTYRASSQCYAASSLTNQVWSAGSGYAAGDKLVLMATSFSDTGCTTPGDGTSAQTSVITTTGPLTFTGPGSFSDTTKWSGGALPQAAQSFVILNSCTFDSAAPARAYGDMTFGDGVTPGSIEWQVGNAVVLDVDDVAVNGGSGVAIDMTNAGTFRVRGNLSLGARGVTGGSGTVELTGSGKTLTTTSGSAIFHHVTVTGTLTIANTFYFDGTLDVQSGGSLSGSGSTIVYPRNGAAITGSGTRSFGQINIESGMSVTASANFSASSTFTIDGTFTPSASTVISGTGAQTGTGTMKVTRNGSNAIGNQYTLTTDTTNNTVEYAGTANQFINSRTYKNVTINNPVTVQLNGDLTITGVVNFVQGLAMGSGSDFIITNSSPSAVVQGNGWTRLTFRRAITTGTNTYLYPIGPGIGKMSVDLTFHDVTVAGSVRMLAVTQNSNQIAGGSGIDNTKDVGNVFQLELASVTLASYDIAITFNALYDAGADPTKFVLRHATGFSGTWLDVPATRTATSISATGETVTSEHYYAIGNQAIDDYVVTATTPQRTGEAFTTTVTAKDDLGITADVSGTVVTMSSSTGNAEFDSDGNGTFGDNTKEVTDGTFTISTKDNTAESVTITATDANSNTGTSSAVSVVAKTFTGPGLFSDTTKWSEGTLPAAGAAFVILNSCTFDNAAPTRAYGDMAIGDGVTSGNLTWQAGNSVVLDVEDVTIGAGNTGVAIDMTDAGTLRVRGNLTVGTNDFTGGSGTVEFNGANKTITSNAAVFHHVDINETLAIGNTLYFDGTLETSTIGTLSGSSSTTLYPRNGAAITGFGTFSFGQINIESGHAVTVSANFSASSTFTIDGTFTPTASTVISGSGSQTGTGTMKVTRNGSNAIGNQYTLTTDTTNNTVEYAGTANQFINSRTYKNVTINNPVTVQLNGDLTITGVVNFVQGLAMGSGSDFIITNSSPTAVIQGNGWTRLTFRRAITTGTNTYLYPIGPGIGKMSVDLTFHDVTVAGSVRMLAVTQNSNQIAGGSGIDNSRDVGNVFQLELASVTLASYDIAITFNALYDAGADPTKFVLRHATGFAGTWLDVPATRTATSISATGETVTSEHYYAIGNQEIDHYAVAAASPQSAGTAFTTTVTAQDTLNVTVDNSAMAVTMTSSTGNAQFDSDGNGTFGDNTKTLTNGTFTISTKDNTPEPVTLTATDTNSKTGSIAITVSIGPASTATTTIDASPSSITADGSSTSTITVQAKDIAGNNLTSSGGPVTLSTNLGTITSVTDNGNGTYTATLTAGIQTGTATITGTINSASITDTAGVVFTLASFGPPPGFSATATSTSQVSLSWAAVSGATNYQIYRGTSLATLSFLASTTAQSHTDSGLSANTTYLYMVRAMNGSASGFSSIDAATTIVFTDPALSSAIKIKAAHLTELRTAVNAMRTSAGLSAATFTDPTLTAGTTTIKRLHITELRTALNAARSTIGLATINYTDPSITAQSTIAKSAHVSELRAGTQ